VVVRNIGHGIAKNITFEFSAPLQSTSGYDITELPYFKNDFLEASYSPTLVNRPCS
jgi:hypothetical protein